MRSAPLLWLSQVAGAASFAALSPRRAALALRSGADDDEFTATNEADYEQFTREMNAGDDEEGPLDLRELDDLNADMDMEELLAKLGGGTKFESDAFGDASPYDQFGADEFATGATATRRTGSGKTYAWEQSDGTMSVALPIPPSTTAKDVKVEYPTRTSVKVEVSGETRLEAELHGAVQLDESFWSLDEDPFGSPAVVLDIQKASGSREMWPGFTTFEGDATLATVTSEAYLDIDVDGEVSRVRIGLFDEDVPQTAANFRSLCVGVEVGGEFRSYKGSPFHRVIPGFMAQGGDVTDGDGTGGVSVYGDGGAFPDESFPFWHSGEGLVSMANSGPDSNKSQFFITLGACTWLDDKHVIFGRVLEGMDVLRKIEQLGSPSGAVSGEVKVVNCGRL